MSQQEQVDFNVARITELRDKLPDFIQADPVKDFVHHYVGFRIHRSQCRIKIWKSDDKYFALAIDMGIGTSVTNAAETIIETVYNKYLNQVPQENIVFAETYENEPEESVDIVIPTWDGRKVSRVEFKHLGILLRGIKKHK